MIPILTLLSFLGASVTLTIAPGPDNTFVLTQGITRGRRSALATAWGMCSGIVVHVTAAAVGISAILLSSSMAFAAIKYAGTAYLLFLAYKAFTEKTSVLEDGEKFPELPFFTSYRRGILMNVLNPKVAVFFLAFLPQFLTENDTPTWVQMIILGLVFMVQGLIVFSTLALFSSRLGTLLRRKPSLLRALTWASGTVLAGMGVRLALQVR